MEATDRMQRGPGRWPFALALGVIAAGWCVPARAQLEEIVVTAQRAEHGGTPPGASLRRTGDYLLLQVEVTNDTRERDARRNEIYDTLRAALAAARKDGSIELSVVDDQGLVIPLRVDSATVVLRPGDRPDTARTTISVKTRIPAGEASGQALVSRLRDFVAAIKPVGRTQLSPDGEVDISIVNPAQYREAVIRLFASDVHAVTAALGEGYRVVVRGIDGPIRWQRAGMLELTLYVPYTYDVIPATVTSYTTIGNGE
jgi:hypothetical protein